MVGSVVKPHLRAVGNGHRKAGQTSSYNGRNDFARYLVDELGDAISTAFTYERHLCGLEGFIGKPITGERITGLDAADVRWFFRESGLHPSTKKSRLVGLKAYVRFLLVEKRCDVEWAAEILALRGPKGRRRMKRPMTPAEALVVLDACKTPLDYRLVYPGLYQGLRVSDSAILEREHFLDDRLAFTSVKGDKYLELPLHLELDRVKEIILQRSTTCGALKSRCQSLSHYTGIPFSTHTLRRTFSRQMDDDGIQEGVVIELLGQEQVTVYRRHYADVSWAAMEVAIQAHGYENTRSIRR